jgi:hypothetical protein
VWGKNSKFFFLISKEFNKKFREIEKFDYFYGGKY